MKKLIAIIVAACSAPAYGQGWFNSIADSGEYFYAGVVNESDAMLGQFCYPAEGNCLWLLAIKTRCESGVSTPILVSSDVGALHVSLVCRGEYRPKNGPTYHRYLITNFDDINKAVRQGGSKIGFAFPLESGEFRVSRFNIGGAGPVIDRMRSAAESANQRPNRPSTKDQTL